MLVFFAQISLGKTSLQVADTIRTDTTAVNIFLLPLKLGSVLKLCRTEVMAIPLLLLFLFYFENLTEVLTFVH